VGLPDGEEIMSYHVCHCFDTIPVHDRWTDTLLSQRPVLA